MVSAETLTRPSGLRCPFGPLKLRVCDCEDGSERDTERYSLSVDESELCVRPTSLIRGQDPAPVSQSISSATLNLLC